MKEIEPLLAPRSAAELEPDYHQDEALLALAELQGLLDQFAGDKTFYVAFSHDDYQTSSGGLQLSVGIEAQVAIDRGDIYLHAHPTTILRTLAPADMDDRPYLRLTLNNRPLGLAGYKLVADAIGTQVTRKSRIIVHQLLGHAPERITEIIRGTSERPIFWLHDYFSLCTSSQLMRNEITFCGAPSVQSNACRICTHGPTRAGHRARIDAMWETNQFLFLAPSRVAAEIFLTKAGLSEHDIKIVPHTAVRFTPTSSGGVAQWPHIRIAFAGNPGILKAWPLFEQIAKRYADDPRFKFFYFGTRRVSEFVTFVQVHVKAQTRNAMVDAIRENDIDIVVHLPPWPETFSFTTQEALAGGAYVVTQKVSGNTAALVADSKRGIILEDAAAYEDLFADGTIVELGREARRRRADETAAVIFSKQCFEIVQDQNAL